MSLFWTSEEHRQGEVGYLLDPAHQGRGYATEAARALLAVGFEADGVPPHHRPPGRAQHGLRAGRRAARHAARGAPRPERAVKGEWADEVVYAMLASEWATAAEVLSNRSA